MRGPSPFTQAQRELIAAFVSGPNTCTYCYGTHVGVAEACGVAPDLTKALLVDIETAPLEARMKPILRHVRKLTLSPARVTEADAAAVYEVGWGDDALYSTVLVTALFNFYNRLVEGNETGSLPKASTRIKLLLGFAVVCLRVHPGSYWGLTKLSDHQADGSPAQERKTVAVEAFPVLGQAATSVEPCDGSFDDPAFGQRHELPDIGSSDDLHVDVAADSGQSVLELRPLVAAVGVEFHQEGKRAEQRAH